MQDPEVYQKLLAFFGQYRSLHYPKGHVVLPAFSSPSGIYLVTKGLVKQYILIPNGQELVVNMYKPGSYFPMIYAMTGEKNNHFFEAVEDIEVYRAPITDTLDFLKREPDVLFDLTRRLYIGMDGLLQQLTLNAIGNTYQKVIATLVMAAKRFGEEQHGSVVIKRRFSHQEIGRISGTGRETVTRTLSQLKKAGLIQIDNKVITILDLKKLEEELLKN